MKHGILAAAREVCNTTRRMGNGSHLSLRQRVRGSVKSVSAIPNSRGFQTETRDVADDWVCKIVNVWKAFIAASKVYLHYPLIGSLMPVFVLTTQRNIVNVWEGFDTGDTVVGILGDAESADLLLPNQVVSLNLLGRTVMTRLEWLDLHVESAQCQDGDNGEREMVMLLRQITRDGCEWVMDFEMLHCEI